MPAQKPHASKQDYGTPADFMAAVTKKFGRMQLDLAASEHNKKAAWYIGLPQDSLEADWRLEFQAVNGCRAWLNPPYTNIGKWVEKCAGERTHRDRDRIHVLVPASIGSEWFAKWVWGRAKVYAVRGRITFEGCTTPYPKDCILIVYGETPGFEVWDWRKECVK